MFVKAADFRLLKMLKIKRGFSISSTDCKNRKKDHWHVLATKKFATDKALEHFDDFYKSIFRLKWPSVRLGLLTNQKYVAIVNNFGDIEESELELQDTGAINMTSLFEAFKNNCPHGNEAKIENTVMNDAFSLDSLLETRLKNQDDNEVKLFYPDGKEQSIRDMMNDPQDSASQVTFNQENAKNDWKDRTVDPDLGVDSGVLHDFVPATKLKGMEDFVAEADYYAYYKPSTDVPVKTEIQDRLLFPENLRVFTYDRGVFERYPQPKKSATGAFNYLLLDGASLLPVLALEVRPGDEVLDMCSAPGGKALAIIQSLAAKHIVCNDNTLSRVNRLHKMFSQFLYDYDVMKPWKGMVSVQQMNGCSIDDTNRFDKILVDVPCTNDRLSLHENDNNIFKQSRIKERLRIPEIQSSLLANALRIVKPGGTVVYSTCSLSPVQNDGVVGMALRQVWVEYGMKFTVVDMRPSLDYTSHLFHYAKGIGLKYGNLIVPFLPSNFGPMYFSKIVKDP